MSDANRKRILFIEEDFASIRYYLSELSEANFDVNHIRNTDDAVKAINSEGALYTLIIVDSAMPPGQIYENEETESGTTTGQFLFRDIRLKLPAIPIIILTNFNSLDWIQKAQATENVRMRRKLDTLPGELVQEVREMISENSVT